MSYTDIEEVGLIGVCHMSYTDTDIEGVGLIVRRHMSYKDIEEVGLIGVCHIQT
jgi:hypothetical protein